jgi:hypothetical protein
MASSPRTVHRTACIRLRLTRHQADRCYALLHAAGDLWAWLIDCNRQRRQQNTAPVVGYQALCRELTGMSGLGELSVAGARSVLQRYSVAWFEAERRRRAGTAGGFPRRKRALMPIRFYNGRFKLDGQRRVRLPVAAGCPALWVRLARPLPYPAEQIRAVTLFAEGGQLWLAVTAAIHVQQHDLDPNRVAGVDLGVIHPYAVVVEQAALLISGRAIRAENYLHLRDHQAREVRAARRRPKPGQQGSRRWRRHRARRRQAEAKHRRRVHQAQHQAAKQVIDLPYGGELAFWSSETPETSPSGTWAESTTSGCGSGDARTWWKPYAIRPRRRESSSGFWTSAAPRPRVQPAGGEFPSHRGAAFCVPTAGFKGTAIWWVPPTSPPGSVAERRARRCQRSLSTVGPARCRHGVIDVATSMIAGGVDPAGLGPSGRARPFVWMSLVGHELARCPTRIK